MALILLGFFIPHWGLLYLQSLNSKTRYQLEEFPRKMALFFAIKYISCLKAFFENKYIIVFLFYGKEEL
jgi:hypothetical protein